MQPTTHLLLNVFTWLLLATSACGVARGEDLAQLESSAVKSAIAAAAPSVVQIQTVGGLDRAGETLLGSGPTTGTILSKDGYIVSSAYNFAQKPASILVTLAGGRRHPAKLIARDHSRMLVLLKIDAENLTPAKPAPQKAFRVGQWAIAVGRSFDADQVNVSVGIVSAINRVWGKAIQTDAKVSPNNYGGPLVEIRGRVQGVLVPLNPQQSEATAGAQWYDGGIGFAVPLEDILATLPRLKSGEDLYAGQLGITLAGGRDLFGKPPVIASARPRSPAADAGLAKDDRIVAVDGRPVETLAQLRHALAAHYAGDEAKITVLRGDERKDFSVPLVAKLEPYVHPFLGILPARSGDGLRVRFVYPASPAAKAGLRAGDEILAANGNKVADAAALRTLLSTFAPADTISLDVRRDGKTEPYDVALSTLPEQVPTIKPPVDDPAAGEVIGRVDLQLPEFANECFVYVPKGYSVKRPHGLVVWLHPPGGHDAARLTARWQTLCQRWNLILLAPRSRDPARWARSDAAFVRKAIDRVVAEYAIDKSRIVAHGHEGGGTMAWLLALSQRDLIRGVAVSDAALPSRAQVPDNEPPEPLAVYVATGSRSAQATRIRKAIKEFRDKKYPVTVVDLGELGRTLRERELEDLCRWIDTLDRI